MDRNLYLDLAASGLRMPVGAHLVLHEKANCDNVRLDGYVLGRVVEETARRYRTPLAIPLMDLTIEKQALMHLCMVHDSEAATHHFRPANLLSAVEMIEAGVERVQTPRMRANADAIHHISRDTDLVAVGMSIGPFSLMTKLLADPITPLHAAGLGFTGADDPEVAALATCLSLAMKMIRRSLEFQIEAGAKAIFVCEPAACTAYLSPRQLAKGSDIFERFVMQPNHELKKILDEAGVDLIFHDCGELIDSMVERLASLRPVILSLGSSRNLWEDARLAPDNVVMFGNLPTKKFYSDSEVPLDSVPAMTCEIVTRMRATGHPFILGSECDVLSVVGREEKIKAKVDAFMTCPC